VAIRLGRASESGAVALGGGWPDVQNRAAIPSSAVRWHGRLFKQTKNQTQLNGPWQRGFYNFAPIRLPAKLGKSSDMAFQAKTLTTHFV
jgi:hypothetical protein